MNALFLRADNAPAKGALPVWPSEAECDDMWIRLFMAVCALGGWDATVQGRDRCPATMNWAQGQQVQWVTRFGLPDAVDILWVRGRYNYEPALRQHANAYKVFLPCGSAIDSVPDRGFNLVLVDSELQIAAAAERFKGARIMVFPKPALDSIFTPMPRTGEFDVVFNCHRLDDFKGYSWLVARLPAGTRVLRIGPKDTWFAAADHLRTEWTGRIPLRDVPRQACRAAVGVVCDDGKWDSGPRILPEFLAMGIPVIVRSTVRASRQYIGPHTGAWVGDDVGQFQQTLKCLLHDAEFMGTRTHYLKHLSLPVAAKRLHAAIAEGVA